MRIKCRVEKGKGHQILKGIVIMASLESHYHNLTFKGNKWSSDDDGHSQFMGFI